MAHRNGTEQLFIEDIGKGGKKIFKVTSTKTMETDYFTNIIYHLILDLEAIELHRLSELVKENKGHVTFLNTDCVECWFNEDKPMDISRYYWDHEKTIPKYKFEEKDESPKYERMKQYKCKDSYWIDNLFWNVTNDPEDNEFAPLTQQILDSNQSINIDGIAGSGKTTMLKAIMEKLSENKKGFAVLAPTNKACRNLGKEALTIHKFLGGSMRDTKTLKRQIEGKDYIIVDEISMVKEVFYSLFLSLKKLKPTLKFIIAGDSRQIDPVCDRVKFDYLGSRVLHELCDGNRLLLTKCRRSDKDLFDFSLSLQKENYKIGKEEHQTSICFTNEKRKERNYYWMKTLAPRSAITVKALDWDPNSQDMKVFKGLPIIARVNNKQFDIFNSEMFTVKYYNIKTKEVHIVDEENEKVIPLDHMTSLFYPAYCVTTHKFQGSSIDKPFTIYEWSKMDKKLKYTAVTRSTKLNYLNIL